MRTTLLKKGQRELWAHKTQYAFLILILGMGIAMFNSMYDFTNSRVATTYAAFDDSLFFDLEVTLEFGQTIDVDQAEHLVENSVIGDDITGIETRLLVDVYINQTQGSKQVFTKGVMIGYDYFRDGNVPRDIEVNKPLFFDPPVELFSKPDTDQCYLEVNFANYYDITSEDTFSVVKGNNDREFTMIERINVPDYFMVITEGSLFPSPESLGVLVVPLETAQIYEGVDAFNGSHINNILIRVSDTVDFEDATQELEAVFDAASIPVTVIDKEEDAIRKQIISDMEGDQQLIGIFPVIIFIVSGFGLAIALRRMIQSHRPQIGVFKAIGVPDRVILLYFLTIGMIIAVLGIIIGYVFSIPINNAFLGFVEMLMPLASTVYVRSEIYYVLSGIIAVVLCVLVTLVPAWFAVQVKPVEVIQGREGMKKKKYKKTRFKQGWLTMGLPTPFRLVARDFARKPIRPLTTILGVALSLALFLSMVVLLDSMLIFFDESQEVNAWDYEISLSGFNPTTEIDQWFDEYDQITQVYPGIRIPVNLSSNSVTSDALLYGVTDLSEVFNLGFDSFGEEGVYLSQYLLDEHELSIGELVDTRMIKLDEHGEFTQYSTALPILGVHQNPIGLFVYSDLQQLQKITRLSGVANVVYLQTDGERFSQDVLNDISRQPGVTSVTHVAAQKEMLVEMLDLIVSMVSFIMFISIVLAIAIVYNLFIVGASEKKREYATMKTLGTSLQRISYLIYIEAVVTIIGGVVLGGIGGFYMAVGMMAQTDVLEGFNFTMVFSWNGFILGSIMVVGVVIFVSLLTIRYINNIIIADVIRDRSTG